jgi:putative transposase
MTKKTSRVDELLDEMIKEEKDPKNILSREGLLGQLTKRLSERALAGELTAHLGYEPHEKAEERRSNSRNGSTKKTVQTDNGPLELQIPRDREGSFEPILVSKHQRRLAGFDEKVLALYARGLTVREIQGHLEEVYGADVSTTLISNVTEEVIKELTTWQSRTLDPVYPIVYFDALFVKTRQDGQSSSRAVYLALAVNMQGEKELLGLWIAATEGAKFWLGVLTELRSRGMSDCFVTCVDGISGFREALEAIYPKSSMQLCIVHKVRSSMRYVPWKDRKAVAAGLREVYGSATLAEAEAALTRFGDRWDAQYPVITQAWRRDWDALTTFYGYSPEIRKVIYTTNAIESLNYSLRRVLKNRGAFPDDTAVLKVLYLAVQRAAKKWTMPVQNWPSALNRFTIMFADRMPG